LIRIERVAELRRQVAEWKAVGERIAMVPTMGNLHAGHLRLVASAQELADRVLVTLFVNPMQFSPGEDLDTYPRTPEADSARLEEIGSDLLFIPPVSEVYSQSQGEETRVEVPGISDLLCGASRPGHFVGVTTVVCKLFNMAQPDLALFGEKDFQQLMVIRRMTEDLHIPVEVVGVPIVRESDGLAMSSRNGYLTADERGRAPTLYRVLGAVANHLRDGAVDYAKLERGAIRSLQEAGFRPDYFRVLRAPDLGEPRRVDRELVILAAAYLGKARLIDNLVVSRG